MSFLSEGQSKCASEFPDKEGLYRPFPLVLQLANRELFAHGVDAKIGHFGTGNLELVNEAKTMCFRQSLDQIRTKDRLATAKQHQRSKSWPRGIEATGQRLLGEIWFLEKGWPSDALLGLRRFLETGLRHHEQPRLRLAELG
jgi:hypothetical protein